MRDRYVFADEAGNFDFSRNPGASRYFIICTVTADECHVGDELLKLRRELGWKGMHLDSVFHATEDPQAVRDEVFSLLGRMDFRVDATLLEKSKAQPHLRDDKRLYKLAWFLHFKHVAPRIATADDRMFVAASSLGTKKARHAFPCGSRRCRATGLTVSVASRRVLAREQRPVPPGCRLLHLGHPAQMGAQRRSIARADRIEDPHRVRRVGGRQDLPLLGASRKRPAPAQLAPQSRAQGLFRRTRASHRLHRVWQNLYRI